MCTLEPLGYASSQYFTIPYLVLYKSLTQTRGDNDTEANRLVLKLVKETCAHIMKTGKMFRANFVSQVNRFLDEPAGRTADVVPDLKVLLA